MLDSKQQQGSEQQGIEHSFNSPLVCAKRGCKATLPLTGRPWPLTQ